MQLQINNQLKLLFLGLLMLCTCIYQSPCMLGIFKKHTKSAARIYFTFCSFYTVKWSKKQAKMTKISIFAIIFYQINILTSTSGKENMRTPCFLYWWYVRLFTTLASKLHWSHVQCISLSWVSTSICDLTVYLQSSQLKVWFLSTWFCRALSNLAVYSHSTQENFLAGVGEEESLFPWRHLVCRECS